MAECSVHKNLHTVAWFTRGEGKSRLAWIHEDMKTEEPLGVRTLRVVEEWWNEREKESKWWVCYRNDWNRAKQEKDWGKRGSSERQREKKNHRWLRRPPVAWETQKISSNNKSRCQGEKEAASEDASHFSGGFYDEPCLAISWNRYVKEYTSKQTPFCLVHGEEKTEKSLLRNRNRAGMTMNFG